MEEYLTVKNTARVETVIERSRFISTIKRVENADEAKAFVDAIRKEFPDATHNCYAYITERGGYSRYSDDGEPSGTAGAPILEVVKGADLLDTAIVVTRYFGGIKLGTGGLVRAYGGAASDAVKKAGVIKRTLCVKCSVKLPYDKQNAFPKIKKEQGVLINTEYSSEVEFIFVIKKSAYKSFNEDFRNALAGKFDIENQGEIYYDI